MSFTEIFQKLGEKWCTEFEHCESLNPSSGHIKMGQQLHQYHCPLFLPWDFWTHFTFLIQCCNRTPYWKLELPAQCSHPFEKAPGCNPNPVQEPSNNGLFWLMSSPDEIMHVSFKYKFCNEKSLQWNVTISLCLASFILTTYGIDYIYLCNLCKDALW